MLNEFVCPPTQRMLLPRRKRLMPVSYSTTTVGRRKVPRIMGNVPLPFSF